MITIITSGTLVFLIVQFKTNKKNIDENVHDDIKNSLEQIHKKVKNSPVINDIQNLKEEIININTKSVKQHVDDISVFIKKLPDKEMIRSLLKEPGVSFADTLLSIDKIELIGKKIQNLDLQLTEKLERYSNYQNQLMRDEQRLQEEKKRFDSERQENDNRMQQLKINLENEKIKLDRLQKQIEEEVKQEKAEIQRVREEFHSKVEAANSARAEAQKEIERIRLEAQTEKNKLAEAESNAGMEIEKAKNQLKTAAEELVKANSLKIEAESTLQAIQTLRESFWSTAFRENGSLVEWRNKLESRALQSDSTASLLINLIQKYNLLKNQSNQQSSDDMVRTLQDISRRAYQFWSEEKLSEESQAELSESWANVFQNELGSNFKIVSVRAGQQKDMASMSFRPGGSSQVQRAESWYVQGPNSTLKANVI